MPTPVATCTAVIDVANAKLTAVAIAAATFISTNAAACALIATLANRIVVANAATAMVSTATNVLFSCTNLLARSKKTANLSMAGSTISPNVSAMPAKLNRILSNDDALAAAVPPTCFSMPRKIMSCAANSWLLSTRALILPCSLSVKLTPDLANAAKPLIGSCNALPNCTALPSAVPKPAAARSSAATVARSNAPPASLTVLVRPLNVANTVCVDLITSASTATVFSRLSA